MAQQFIKIFDDTVLKQSVNQGFEVQRTNSRLGKFTMGELAFTRDTGRLFAGTYTNLNEDKDANPILGGSLVGNKYLGLIDSKPLTHWNSDANKTSIQFPLSYTTENTGTVKKKDSDGNTYDEPLTEPALFGKNSKFRIDKNNGWAKEATYNETYDAYNGDYIYDVYNNAIILFDKNIKPLQSTDDKNWETHQNIQQFKKPDGEYYTETTGDFSTNRTRLENVVKNTIENQDVIIPGNPNHQIYGDGYVVMRILEPDGITLGYKDRIFSQVDGTAENNNYSHNYLELKSIPINVLHKMFDEDQFTTSQSDKDGNTKISLSGKLNTLSLNAISGKSLTLPAKLSFNNDGEICTYNFTDREENTTKILGVNISNEIVKTSPPILEIKTDTQTFEYELFFGEKTVIDLSNGEVDDESGSEDDETNLGYYKVYNPFIISGPQPIGIVSYDGATLFDKQGIAISQELVPAIKDDEEHIASEDDPHYEFVNYDSSGRGSYSEETSIEDEDEPLESTREARFKHGYVNVKLNHVKVPEPILWKNGSGKGLAQFFIRPFVVSPTNFNDSIDPKTNEISYGCIGNVGVTGDGLSDNPYVYESAENISISDENITGIKIPEHAQSVICEVSNYSTGFLYLYTSTRYNPDVVIYNPDQTEDEEDWTEGEGNQTEGEEDQTQNKGDQTEDDEYYISEDQIRDFGQNFLNVTNHSIPSLIYSKPRVKIIDSIINRTATPNLTIKTIELPLYRDANDMKHFTLGFNQEPNSTGEPSITVIRVIGYRA